MVQLFQWMVVGRLGECNHDHIMFFKFLKSKRKLIVFVKNRLVSTDAIMPLLIEMKEVYGVQSDIIVFDKLAHEGINENVVIRDALKYIGKEIYITKGKSSRVLRRVHSMFSLFSITYDAFRGAKILHFGILDQWPLNVLGGIFKENVYHIQSNAYNFDKFKFKNKLIDKYTLTGNNLVSFGSKYIKGRHIYDYESTKVFEFGPPKKRNNWLQYIYNKSDYYFNYYHNDIDTSKGVIVLIMSSLDGCAPLLREGVENKQVKLFLETLEVLLEFEIPILVKPHVYTNMTLLNSLIDNKGGIYITQLHPSILATKSRMFIANQFSNTLADAHSLGITTIEYTDYSEEMLKGTRGKSISSIFVNHFINNDINHFKKIVSNILKKDFFFKKVSGRYEDKSGLLLHLSTFK